MINRKVLNLIQQSTSILMALASHSSYADCSTFQLQCNPCGSGTAYKVSVTCQNQNADQGVIQGAAAGSQSQTVAIYPTLPDDPSDKYSIYKGQSGSFLSLKIYPTNFQSPNNQCNSTLDQTPLATGETPSPKILNAGETAYLFCQVTIW